MLAAFVSPGRRKGFRRAGEARNAYVDRPALRVVAWALVVMGLCVLDALLTIIHVRAGGGELVPTMAFALTHGESAFVGSKMATTGAGVWFLALHQNFFVARMGYRLLLSLYSGLTVYHLVLAALR